MPVTIHDDANPAPAALHGPGASTTSVEQLGQGAETNSAARPQGRSAATPADTLNADGTVTTRDSRGREITLKKLKAIGEKATNLPYMALAATCFAVTKLDGEAQMPILTIREMEAMVVRLDDEGLEAAQRAYGENFLPPQLSEDEQREAVRRFPTPQT